MLNSQCINDIGIYENYRLGGLLKYYSRAA
jgi:hypothetical protein